MRTAIVTSRLSLRHMILLRFMDCTFGVINGNNHQVLKPAPRNPKHLPNNRKKQVLKDALWIKTSVVVGLISLSFVKMTSKQAMI